MRKPNGMAWYTLLLVSIILMPMWAGAEGISINLGDTKGTAFSSKIIQLVGLITILSVAPAILVMVTSFTRIVVVLSFLRTALGLQQTPPNQVIISLALFLTMFVMTPVFEEAYEVGLKPMMNEEIDERDAMPKIMQPFKKFMLENTRDKDLELFVGMSGNVDVTKADMPLHVLIPAFMISELKRGFEIGFLIFLPFLIIDMLVASTLMAMGMMMIPPVMISLPFKLVFFVLIDGWYMLCGSLVKSYGL
jgi:flagellar biosynthetic protein FliP